MFVLEIMPSFAYLECHCSLFRRVRSRVLLLYLVVSMAAARVRRELQGSADMQPLIFN